MDLTINIPDIIAIRGKSAEMHPFQYLNEIYKDQGLQFDEYGNPICLPSDEDKN